MDYRLERAIPDKVSPKSGKDEDELGTKRTPSGTKQEQQQETGHPATATTNVEMMKNEKHNETDVPTTNMRKMAKISVLYDEIVKIENRLVGIPMWILITDIH